MQLLKQMNKLSSQKTSKLKVLPYAALILLNTFSYLIAFTRVKAFYWILTDL